MSTTDATDSPPVTVREVRVWELPVRIVHWVIFFCVVVLSVTGFYIGRPFLLTGSDPAFVMGWVRSVHMLAAWTMIAAVVARIIWAFTGNQWSRWDQFIPRDRERRHGGREALKYYLFLRRDPPGEIGHNPLAGLTYTVLYTMFVLQIILGLALHGLDEPGGVVSSLTGWVFSLGSIPAVRLIHHLIMWLTWGFVVHHVYSAVLVDSAERTGIISSIFTGRKIISEDRP